jgi:hypothetical protein
MGWRWGGTSERRDLDVRPRVRHRRTEVKGITLRAHFDGEQIRLDEPFELEPGTPLIVTICPKEDRDRDDWLHLSALGLEEA